MAVRNMLAAILLIGLIIALLAFAANRSSGTSVQFIGGDPASSPGACSAGNALTRVTEDATGVLSLVCSTFVSSLAQGAHTLTGAITFLNSSSIGWNVFNQNFQAKLLSQSCPANQFVKTVADTIICDVVVNSANALTGALTWAATSPLTVASAGSTITYACPTCISSGNYVHLDADVNLATAAPTLVQNTFATFTTGTSGTKAFGSNLAKNNLVIVCAGQSGASSEPTAPTDTLSLSYVAVNLDQTNTVENQCWRAMSKAGGADTVTGHYAATCTATNLCTLFIQEISSSDSALVVAALSTTRSSSTTCTACTMTSISFTNTPLLLGFYQHNTAQTCTAGASFSVLNAETGSLQYCTEKSTSLTSTSSTFPVTIGGTAQVNAGIGLVILKAASLFSVVLNANTNYVFHASISYVSAADTTGIVWLHSMAESGVTLQTVCMLGTSNPASNDVCFTTTDTNLFTSGILASVSYELYGTIKVGATSTTLAIEFGDAGAATTNAQTYKAGSFILVAPTT